VACTSGTVVLSQGGLERDRQDKVRQNDHVLIIAVAAVNHNRVKRYLGVFKPCMSFYMLYKRREYPRMGFPGFEARYFRLFADIQQDMAPIGDLLRFFTALAYHFMAMGAPIFIYTGRSSVTEYRVSVVVCKDRI
jgi:hypothetical protein